MAADASKKIPRQFRTEEQIITKLMLILLMKRYNPDRFSFEELKNKYQDPCGAQTKRYPAKTE